MRFLQISLRFYSSFSEVLKMNVTGSWDTGNGGACPPCPPGSDASAYWHNDC